MKLAVPVTWLIFILAGCSSGKAPAISQHSSAGIQLPEFKVCKADVVVEDPDFTGERNFLETGAALSYSHTYLGIHHNSDSLVRERLRKETADLARTIVKVGYPAIEIARDSMFRSKTYTDISFRTAQILNPGISETRRKKLIGELVTPAKSNRQLFIHIKSYRTRGGFRNMLNLFVFDTKALRLLYYDFLAYQCDIRDKTAFSKVLNYAIAKLPPASQ